MRHRSAGKKLSRTREHRKALFRNMVTTLLEKGKIETTIAKAKALKPVAEKIITLGKRNDLSAKRQAFAFITKPEVVKKLFEQIGPQYKDRPGGYTRIIRTYVRQGDATQMAILELVGMETVTPSSGKTETNKKEKAS